MKLIIFNNAKECDKLNHLPFNRNFSVRTDLMDKMNQYGFTVPINIIKTDVIDGVSKLWIADGQHRAATALHLGIPFTGIVNEIPFKKVDDIVKYVSSLNSASKSWSLKNYVEAYNFLNYIDYNTLLKLSNSSPYSVNTLSAMLTGVRSTTNVAEKVKTGQFKINLYDETVDTINHSAVLSKYGRVTSRMIHALHYVKHLPRFDKAKFNKAYISKINTIKELKLDDYTELFQSWT